MKAYILAPQAELYWEDSGNWTPEISKAKYFQRAREAFAFVRDHRMAGSILLDFGDSDCDCSPPASEHSAAA
jgi:hypothetical protein